MKKIKLVYVLTRRAILRDIFKIQNDLFYRYES